MHPLTQLYQGMASVLSVTFFAVLFGWFLYTILRKSEDPARIAFKMVISAGVIGGTAWMIRRNLNQPFDFYDLSIMMVCAFAMIVLWRHELAGLVSRPIEALFTGGDVPPDPKPYYSIAEARRKLGRYPEAVAEIRKQLEQFPNDFYGQMMLAEIQAQNLDDLAGAELTISRLVAQPGHAPVNIAHALFTLADWHLKFALDREAARADLQKIIELIPGSEQALVAEQRIAHLASTEKLLASHDRQKYAVREGIQNLGLRTAEEIPKLVEVDTDGVAAGYVKHLEEFPLDFEVREKLALIYADHYRRLDLATNQLEQMIEAVNQPKKIVHWLNLLADLQVRHGADYATVEGTLQRILDRFPNMPETEIVRARLSHLKLEFKAQTKDVRLKMGTYEQNIGLKGSKQY